MPTEHILGFDDALALLAAEAQSLAANPLASETVPLDTADNRVLAADLLADRDQPPFPRSTRDGYAIALPPGFAAAATTVPAGALVGGEAGRPAPFRLLGEVRAGTLWTGPALQPGEAVEIMTGAPVPPGAHAVVMLEHSTADAGALSLAPEHLPRPGDNIVPRAAELQAGAPALLRGTRLRPAEIAVAASVGAAHLPVYLRPRVSILATGDELIGLASTPAPHQIRNSNTYALAALVRAAGATPLPLPITPDTPAALHTSLAAALPASDLLLLSGGVSAGRYDFVETVLADLGATFRFTGVRMQPGKPVVFGSLPRPGRAPLPFFGLPGNPVSTQVTFHCLVAPFLHALAGEPPSPLPFTLAHLAEPVAPRPSLTRVLPATLSGPADHPTISLVAWQGSGDQASNARANAYAVLHPSAEPRPAGGLIPVLLR